MINRIKKLILEIKLNFASSDRKAELYRKHFGIKIGSRCRFTGKITWATEPYLIEIGDDVTITQNVTFHTHDGGVGLFRSEYPGINVFGRIKIGNQVFIGSHVIIMPGVTVGNNVIIGAGSVVTKNLPDDSVCAGVPCRPISSLEEYKNKVLKKAVFINHTDPEKRKMEILEKIKSK